MASLEAKVVIVSKTVINYLLGFPKTAQPNLLYLVMVSQIDGTRKTEVMIPAVRMEE